jgi:elongation factor 2
MTILTKSPNKHNRLWLQAEPISAALCDDIDGKRVNPNEEPRARAKYLQDKHSWDPSDA